MQQQTEARPIDFGFYPFWFWNGDMTEPEIRWQIAQMADKGIRGFFIHPRQGLRQPYLSDAFFRLVRVAIEAAESHGLVVHLYDEYPYPSGVAGGQVTLGMPHFHATRLIQRHFDVPGGPLRRALPVGKVLSCMAYPRVGEQIDWSGGVNLGAYVGVVLANNSYNETGLTSYNQKRYFASHPTPTLETGVLKGPHRIFVSVQAVVDHHKYWGDFVDVLNPEAIRHFIQLTHERYRAEFGDQFGKRIHSIFVDETTPGWSECIPRAFLAEYDYNLLPLLPALADRTHPQHLKVAFDLDRLRYKLFCQSFEEQISGWCRRHNLRYSGEKGSQRLAQLKYMDIPGCEPGHTKAGAPMDLLRAGIRQNARATASAAYFYGKQGSLCECFHSLGWSGTLQDAKLISEGLMLMGIRYLVPHGFFYTTHSLTKHDAPPTFFFQMPYWLHFGALSKRIDRIARHFEGTYIDAEVLVVDPNSGLPTRTDLRDYQRLLNMLMGAHIDFLMVDTDILESGEVKDGKVHIRDISVHTVLLPQMQIVEAPLEKWLNAFEQAGGTVIRFEAAFETDPYLLRLLETAKPSLEITSEKLQIVTRADGNRRLWFLLNTVDIKLHVEFRSASELREIPLDDDMPNLLTQTEGVYARTIYPFESLLITELLPMIPAGDDNVHASPSHVPPTVIIPVASSAKVVPKNKNLLRMYDWQMELLDEDNQPLQQETVPAVPLPNQLAHGGFRFAPKLSLFFGSAPQLELPLIHVNYRFEFENQFSGQIELIMEPNTLVGDWTIQINSASRMSEADFNETEAHVRGSLATDITDHVKMGTNTITISLRTDRIDGGLVNPLYLAGDFGVALNPLRLVDFNPTGGYEAWEENGLPYYAGIVEYESTFNLEQIPDAETTLVELEHGVPFQDAVEISINNSKWQPMLWSPYRGMFPRAQLNVGTNFLKIRVYTTLIRSFEGQWFDIQHHCYRRIGTTHD